MEICFRNVMTIEDEEYGQFLSDVSGLTVKRTDKMRFDIDRKSSVVGEALVRRKISEKTGVAPSGVEIKYTKNGKPYIDGDIYFNISHSDGCVVCVFDDKNTGIDIEKIREPHYNTMRKYCTEKEKEYIMSGDNKEVRFFEIWTLKEAYLKATGQGITGGLLSVEFAISDGKVSCSDEKYECRIIYNYDGFVCSVCSER